MIRQKAMNRITSFIFSALALLFASAPASAQSACPYIVPGAVLTAGQWQACFQAKADITGVPLTPANVVGAPPITTSYSAPTFTIGLNINNTTFFRTRLSANTTFYVNGDNTIPHPCGLATLRVSCLAGSDLVTAVQAEAVTGGTTAPTPFLTLNTAILAVTSQIDWNGFRPTIALADGNPGANYGGASCAFPIGTNGAIWIQGNDADYTTVTLTALNSTFALYTTHYCIVRLRSVTVSDQGSSVWGLEADNYGGVDIQNVGFTAFNSPMIRVGQTGHLELVNPLGSDDVFVKGNAPSWLRVDTGGNANFGSSSGNGFTQFFTVNIANGLTFSNGFINVPSGAVLFNLTSTTFTGFSYTGTGLIANGPGFMQTNANVPCATVFSASSGGCVITNGFQTDANDPTTYNSRTAIVAGALPNSSMAFSVTGTFPTSPSTAQNAILFDITGAGSASQITRAFRVTYEAGYTGSSQTNAFSVVNNSAGTGNTLIFAAGGNSVVGNLGNSGTAVGATAGLNAGGAYFAANGSVNAGIVGEAQVATNSALNLGVVGSAINTGTSGLQVGGYFSINQTVNPTVSAALIADNGPGTSCASAACPIALFRANAVTKVTVDASGNVQMAGNLTASQIYGGTANNASIIISSTSGGSPSGDALALHASSMTMNTNSGTGSVSFSIGSAGSGSTGIFSVVGMSNSPTTSAVCYNTSTSVFTYDGTIGTCNTSTMRAKHDIRPLDTAAMLAGVLRMQPDSFLYNEDQHTPGEQLGLMAEELEKIDPRLVGYDDKGRPNSIRYLGPMFSYVVGAVKELKADNDDLRRELKRAR